MCYFVYRVKVKKREVKEKGGNSNPCEIDSVMQKYKLHTGSNWVSTICYGPQLSDMVHRSGGPWRKCANTLKMEI